MQGGSDLRLKNWSIRVKDLRLRKNIMKTKFGAFFVGVLFVIGVAAYGAESTGYQHDELRPTLEKVYADYLSSIEHEDPALLSTVVTSTRLNNLQVAFESNGMKFPKDFFAMLKKSGPKLPPTSLFHYIATSSGGPYANLIYGGNMNGYLNKTQNGERFLLIQFEKEGGAWKYSVILDPPLELVPDLQAEINSKELSFLNTPPFKPDRIEARR